MTALLTGLSPRLAESDHIQRLQPREGRLRVVIDTETFNEVDDQFALVYSLQSPERLSVGAIYAAPFTNECAATTRGRMEQSYDEILRLLSLFLPRPPAVHHALSSSSQ